MMYLISIAVVVIATLIMSLISGMGLSMLLNCFDVMCIFSLFIFTFPMLVASGLLKDFNRAFRLAFKKEQETNLVELKRAIEAVGLVMKSLIFAGSFIFVFILILILSQLDDPATLGPKLAIAIITILYAVGISLFLLPLHSRLKIKMLEYMQQE